MIAHLGLATLAVVELVAHRTVKIPVVLALVATCTLISLARHIEHITLGVLQRIPIVAQTTRDGKLIASLVDFPDVVGSNLCQLLLI